jgi:murein DD-endopeptidase MepM/ murein hydrolase activator NlpD
MADSLREQAWRFVCATFPERQIYIRSDGRVQFFTFGPLMQTILAGITLAFLGWVAFTSVNVVFKDHIIAVKDKRYQQMQASYETRVTDLQLAYDQLNGALVSAADHFKASVDDLEAKHRTLSQLIGRKDALQTAVNSGAVFPNGVDNAPVTVAPPAANVPAGDSLSEGGEGVANLGPPPGSATTNPNAKAAPAPAPAKPAPALRPTHSSFLEGAVEKLASAFTHKQAPSAPVMKHPVLRQIATEQARLNRLEGVATTLTSEAERNVASEISHLQGAMRVAGIDANTFVARAGGAEGMGGPLIPLSASVLSGVQDVNFSDSVVRITAELDQLADVVKAMHSVPLTVPVMGPEFGLSSGFGARVDPFTKRLAFHAGLDFTGPWGSTIHATAPGTVVYAGPRGPYGNCVEIDHGMGIKTRYGHLSAILVQPGTKVDKGTPIGRLGSSGRSTGPHVHYEVWYGEAARDPARFIEAGRYVLKD